jgi:hypothetical protein
MSNVAASLGAGYATNSPFDFAGGCLDVELVSVPDPTQTAQAFIQIYGTNVHATFFVGFTGLNASLMSPGENDYSPPATFDAVHDRWLRIVENGGMWFFQTAPDHATYTTFFAMAFPYSGQNATLYLYAESGNGGTSLGQVQYGSVRVTGP